MKSTTFKQTTSRRPIIPFLVIMSLGIVTLLSWQGFWPTAEANSPIQAITKAWERVQASNTYRFDTHIEQTQYPLPALHNVGRAPQTDHIYVAGERHDTADLLEMTLWQGQRGTAESGLTVKRENGQTYRRTPHGTWEPHDGLTDLFAPNGDPLLFLQTAKNITPLGQDNRTLGENLTFTYEKYSFDLDTTAYANQLRQQLEAQMAQYGRLPAGFTLQTPDVYRQMTGTGQLWLDENGLPRRLEMSLELPATNERGRVSALITTDLSGYDTAAIEAKTTAFWQGPTTWLTAHQAQLVTAVQNASAGLIGFLFLFVIVQISRRYWRREAFYTAVVALIIFAMTATPLIETAQASDFMENWQAARADAQTQQAEAEAERELRANLEETQQAQKWNPHQNPLETTTTTPPLSLSLSLSQTATLTDTTDTDGDGLFDVDETVWGTDPNVTDTDGDSLSDGVEVNDLGTHPDMPDSDLDGIADNDEITSFELGGQTWYLNPREEDSNEDGLIDGIECRARTSLVTAEYNPTAVCPDTDSDGVPDVFDDDNDDDGVPDSRDASPFTASLGHDADNPLQLEFDNLALDRPVFVDLQIRPQDASNLNLYNHVLDWPTGDSAGQIQRLNDTTWADTDNLSLRSEAANAANGDIRLVPMLELTMPYTTGHYANLPITTTAPSTRNPSDTVDTWLDSTQMEPLGVSTVILSLENT